MHYSKVLLLRDIDINTGPLLRPNYFDQNRQSQCRCVSSDRCAVKTVPQWWFYKRNAIHSYIP